LKSDEGTYGLGQTTENKAGGLISICEFIGEKETMNREKRSARTEKGAGKNPGWRGKLQSRISLRLRKRKKHRSRREFFGKKQNSRNLSF